MNLSHAIVRRTTLPGILGAGMLALLPLIGPEAFGQPPDDRSGAEAPPRVRQELERARRDRARAEERKAVERTRQKEMERRDEEARDRAPLEELFGEDSPLFRSLRKLGNQFEKEVTERFGPDSELADELKDLGKRVEKDVKEAFGPGSEFEATLKQLGKDLEGIIGPDSELSRRLHEALRSPDDVREDQMRKDREDSRPREQARPAPKPEERPRANPGSSAKAKAKAEQIKRLESMMQRIEREIQRLQADEDDAS